MIFLTFQQSTATYCQVYTPCLYNVHLILVVLQTCVFTQIHLQHTEISIWLFGTPCLLSSSYMSSAYCIAKCAMQCNAMHCTPLKRQHFPLFSRLGPIRVTISSRHFCTTRNLIRKSKFFPKIQSIGTGVSSYPI